MNAQRYILIGLIAWNLIVMFLYGEDKLKARHQKWRTSEAALLWSAFLMGGAGAIFGMILFNHKTSKMKFRLLVPLAVLINSAVIFAVVRFNILDITKINLL